VNTVDQTRQDNISYFLQGDRIWPPNWVFAGCGDRFRKALVDVFWRLDEDAYYEAEELWFVLDTGEFLALNVPRDIIVPVSPSPHTRSYDTVFITSRAWHLCDEALVGLLAHEIAHSLVKRQQHAENEEAADDLVRKWGFGPELDALHHPQ
jgi:hypothetical protein